MSAAPGGRDRRAGFSYVEVLVATVFVALALIPALEALEVGIKGGAVHEAELTRHYHLVAKLEEVLARPFAELEAEEQAAGGGPTSYSDSAGAGDRRLVVCFPSTPTAIATPTRAFCGLRVEIETTEHVLETLTAQ